mgnify:CR=1 FL=1
MNELPIFLQQKIHTLLQSKQPAPLIIKLENEGEYYWLKQRPASKKTFWHYLQKTAGFCIPFPMLKPTASKGGSESLLHEAERLTKFKAHNIPVVPVVSVSERYLLTKDSGIPLNTLLEQCLPDNRYPLLLQAMENLITLHQHGLCHGRPSPKDIVVENGTFYWLDLEENPLEVMSLAQAQARDLWLLLNGLAKYIPNDQWTQNLLLYYLNQASIEITVQLKHFVKILRPLRITLNPLPARLIGKEAFRAVKINKIIEEYFRH